MSPDATGGSASEKATVSSTSVQEPVEKISETEGHTLPEAVECSDFKQEPSSASADYFPFKEPASQLQDGINDSISNCIATRKKSIHAVSVKKSYASGKLDYQPGWKNTAVSKKVADVGNNLWNSMKTMTRKRSSRNSTHDASDWGAVENLGNIFKKEGLGLIQNAQTTSCRSSLTKDNKTDLPHESLSRRGKTESKDNGTEISRKKASTTAEFLHIGGAGGSYSSYPNDLPYFKSHAPENCLPNDGHSGSTCCNFSGLENLNISQEKDPQNLDKDLGSSMTQEIYGENNSSDFPVTSSHVVPLSRQSGSEGVLPTYPITSPESDVTHPIAFAGAIATEAVNSLDLAPFDIEIISQNAEHVESSIHANSQSNVCTSPDVSIPVSSAMLKPSTDTAVTGDKSTEAINSVAFAPSDIGFISQFPAPSDSQSILCTLPGGSMPVSSAALQQSTNGDTAITDGSITDGTINSIAFAPSDTGFISQFPTPSYSQSILCTLRGGSMPVSSAVFQQSINGDTTITGYTSCDFQLSETSAGKMVNCLVDLDKAAEVGICGIPEYRVDDESKTLKCYNRRTFKKPCRNLLDQDPQMTKSSGAINLLHHHEKFHGKFDDQSCLPSSAATVIKDAEAVKSYSEATGRPHNAKKEHPDRKNEKVLVNKLEVETSIGQDCSTLSLQEGVGWVCCDNCSKWRSIPEKLADFIEETDCRWTCRDNSDKRFADCSIPQEKSNAEINAELGIPDEEAMLDKQYNDNLSANNRTQWISIKSNLYLHRARKKQTIDEIMVCHCQPSLDGSTGCKNGCLNRMLNIECIRGTCPFGDLCSNQQFQRRKYAKLKCFISGKKGYGLKLLENVLEGDFLIEYVGEVLDMATYEARQREYASMGQEHFYFMTLNAHEVIDACRKGNLGRFINHSCEPNCRTEKWMVKGEVCIGLFAMRDINKGEEITFDYNYVRVVGAVAKKCFCGSTNCRGFIGGDVLNGENNIHYEMDGQFSRPSKDRALVLKQRISSTTDILDATNDNQELNVEKRIQEPILANSQQHELVHLHEFISPCIKGTTDVSLLVNLEIDNHSSLGTVCKSVNDAQPSEASTGITSQRKFQAESNLDNKARMSSITPEGGRMVNMKICHPKIPHKDANDERSSVAADDKSLCGAADHKSLSGVADDKSLLGATDDKSVSGAMNNKSGSGGTDRKILRVTTNRKNWFRVADDKDLHGAANEKSLSEAANVKPVIDWHTFIARLNALKGSDGGLLEKKNITKGFLKLLSYTASSSIAGNKSFPTSVRELLFLLNALLDTESEVVLRDIINKNGLQMLHMVMKQNQGNYLMIPVIRRVIKIFKLLGSKSLLSVELIHMEEIKGVESLMGTMLRLSRDNDREIRTGAREFKNEWMPLKPRKRQGMDPRWHDQDRHWHGQDHRWHGQDHRWHGQDRHWNGQDRCWNGQDHCWNGQDRHRNGQDRSWHDGDRSWHDRNHCWHDRDHRWDDGRNESPSSLLPCKRQAEFSEQDIEDNVPESKRIHNSTPYIGRDTRRDASSSDQHSCDPLPDLGFRTPNEIKTRKRKSRWDQDKPFDKRCKPIALENPFQQNIDDEVPPGFAPPPRCTPLHAQGAVEFTTTATVPFTSECSMARETQERFASQLTASHGIDSTRMQQLDNTSGANGNNLDSHDGSLTQSAGRSSFQLERGNDHGYGRSRTPLPQDRRHHFKANAKCGSHGRDFENFGKRNYEDRNGRGKGGAGSAFFGQ